MTPVEAVAVVVPAHDEEALLGDCLDALAVAASRVRVPVHVLVVLDDCTDRSADIASAAGVSTIAGGWRNVGAARRAGVDHAMQRLPSGATTWLATTDADSRVEASWLERQLAFADAGADLVLGSVDVDLGPDLRARYDAHYAASSRVHGASLGVRSSAYLRVGGFRPLPVGEDQDLANRLLEDPAATVVRAPGVRVLTSGRRSSRVVGGFASLLTTLT